MTAAPADALLVLADGETFEGVAVGHRPGDGVATGEVVFNTSLAGYQEILTDPSYAGQIITFTYPHIGNYGVNERDDEARRPAMPRCDRARPRTPAVELARHRRPRRVPRPQPDLRGSPGIDTRRLTRHIRARGRDPGCVRGRRPRHAARGRAGRRRHRRLRPRVGRHARRSRTRSVPTTPRSSWSRTTSGSSGRSSTSSSSPAARSRSCPRARAAPTCSPARPTACSCRTAPAIRPRSPRRATACAACSATSRCSASASVTR